ncbi:VOC family protein [Pseudobacteriovorax antillogorgiicola]
MKINGGIITDKLAETRAFYMDQLGFQVTFDSDWFCLLHCPGNPKSEVAFLTPHHPSQGELFQKPFKGDGVFFTIEVDNVDEVYAKIRAKGVNIALDIRDEEWGDRHFAVTDPNGIGIDFVTHNPRS